MPLPEASSGFRNPPFPCSKLSPNGNTCPWKPPEPPPPPPRSPELSWSIIGGGPVPEPPKPPSAPVKPASAEAKLGRPRICSRKSSLVASDGLLAMRCNSLSRTRPSRGESRRRVTSFKEHLHANNKEREREFCFALLCFALLLYNNFFSTERVLREQRKTKRMGGFILVKNVTLYLNGPFFLHYYTSTHFLFIAISQYQFPIIIGSLRYGVVLGNPTSTCQLPLSQMLSWLFYLLWITFNIVNYSKGVKSIHLINKL